MIQAFLDNKGAHFKARHVGQWRTNDLMNITISIFTQRFMKNPTKFIKPFLTQGFFFVSFVLFSLLFFNKVIFTHSATFLASWDGSTQFYAWLIKLTRAWRNFDIPLWDFSINGGTSFVGELQTAPFYPFHIFLAWLTTSVTQYTIDGYIVLHFALASYFMFLFLRMNRLHFLSQMIGALIYAYVGTIAQKAEAQANIFIGMAYLPIIVAFFQKSLKSTRFLFSDPWLYLCGISLGLTMLAGHLQPYIHSILALSLFMLFSCFRAIDCSIPRGIAKLTFVLLVSIIFSAIQWVPTLEYLSHSYRWIGWDKPIKALAPTPYEVYGYHEILRIPELLSILKAMHGISDGATLFITRSGLILACIGSFTRKRVSWFFLALALFSVLVALGDHTIVGQLSWYIPTLNKIREPIRILFLYHFAMASLAAMGVQLITNIWSKHKWGIWIIGTLMGLLLINELFILQNRLIHPMGDGLSPDKFYAKNEVVNYLERELVRDGNIYRVINHKDSLSPNIGNVYRIGTTIGYRATMYAPYFDYLNRDWDLASVSYDKLGVKYIVSKERLEGFKEVMHRDNFYLYKRAHALPIFQMIDVNGKIKSAKVSSIVWSENSVKFNLENSEIGQLFFAQPYYPGWKAYTDGKESAVSKKDIFMAIQLNGKEKNITFSYCPRYIYPCLIGILFVLLGFFLSLFYIRKP